MDLEAAGGNPKQNPPQTLPVEWHLCSFDALQVQQLYEILKLRQQVFCLEQDCLYLDIDDKDPFCLHLFAECQGKIIAVLRILPENLSWPEASIGRFAVDPAFRNLGLGRQAMETALAFLKSEWNEPAVRIEGQAYLKEFYESLGFACKRGPYLEDGIPHFEMLLDFPAEGPLCKNDPD